MPQKFLAAKIVAMLEGDGKSLVIATFDFFTKRSVPVAVWLAMGTFATENRGDLRLQCLVLSQVGINTLCN